jgi:hypothetical protein
MNLFKNKDVKALMDKSFLYINNADEASNTE